MGFNPLKEKGVPLEEQFKSWDEVNVKPFDKHNVHPYTRTRVILMNGIEVEGALFKHQFARHAGDMEIRRKIAATRRIEQQQQKMVNWLIPGDQSDIEVTLRWPSISPPGSPGTKAASMSRRPSISPCWKISIISTVMPISTR